MFLYILLAGMPTVLYLVYPTGTYSRESSQWKKRYLFFCGIFLFLMIALRHYSVGSDDSSIYYNEWEHFSKTSLGNLSAELQANKQENGFLIIVWALSHVFAHPQWIFVLSGAFFTWSICRFLYKNCNDLLLGMTMFICLGLYGFMVQGLRQAIAMSICLFAIESCKKRNIRGFIVFLLLAFIAMQFHQTAIIFLPVFFLYGKRMDSIWTLVFIGALIAGLMATSYLINFANSLFDRDFQTIAESGGYIPVIIYAIILISGFVFSNKEGKHDLNFSFFIFLTAIGVAMYIMRFFGARIAERASYFFAFGQLIALPKTISFFEFRFRKVISVLIIALSILLFMYRLQSSVLVPYMFFWQTA